MKPLSKAQFDALMKKLKKDGSLTASGVLADAESPTSKLHSLFQWDDSKAANEFRLIEARKVIKRINITIEEPTEQIINVPAIKGEGQYKTASVVIASVSDYESALSEAITRLTSAEKAVQLLSDLADDQPDENAAILMVAMQGIKTVNNALHRLH